MGPGKGGGIAPVSSAQVSAGLLRGFPPRPYSLIGRKDDLEASGDLILRGRPPAPRARGVRSRVDQGECDDD